MKIETIRLSECENADGLLVVIDVLRAFTTAAYAFAAGVQEIVLVGTVEEAFARKEKDRELLLMGEVEGRSIPGFDFGNSPAEIARASVKGKRFVQRTTAGTQGVVRAKKADFILTASFPVAEATLRKIHQINPKKTTLVVTGDPGDEDWAFADYMEECLKGKRPDPTPYLRRVEEAPEAKELLLQPHCPPSYAEDIQCAIALNRFSFAMQVFQKNLLRAV